MIELNGIKIKDTIIITISGSPIELVREMSIKYGFDDYVGTKYILNENNIYTGEIIPMWDSVSKQTAIENFVCKYNIDLDAKLCLWGYFWGLQYVKVN